MASVSVSGGKELTFVQRAMFQAAIDHAVASGTFFVDLDEMTQFFRAEGVPEDFLGDIYFKARTNLWLGSIRQLLSAGRPPSPPYSAKNEPSGAAPDRETRNKTAMNPGDDGGVPIVTFQTKRCLLISMSCDNGVSWGGFSSRLCEQDGNFIAAEAAARLQLGSTIGSKHKLLWHAQSGSPDRKTRSSYFTVVSDDAMDVDVGVNWTCSGGTVDDQDDVVDDQDDVVDPTAFNVGSESVGPSIQLRPSHRHSSNDPEADGVVQPWSEQAQAIVPHVPHHSVGSTMQCELIRVHQTFLDTFNRFRGFVPSPSIATAGLTSDSVVPRNEPRG